MAKKRYYKSEAEKMGSDMMPSGKGEFANMPTASFVKYFPKNVYMTSPEYPDSLKDIDKQISGDVTKAKKQSSKTKF